MNKSIHPIVLAISSGILMTLAWPPLPTAFILPFALIPLLLAILNTQAKRVHLTRWWYAMIGLFIFNLGTTWWVWNASPGGCIAMLIVNTLLMSLPFLALSYGYQKWPQFKLWTLLPFYLCFEFWHFNWGGSWPWLTLGKGLAVFHHAIQFYEYTGEMGGSAVVLIINIWCAHLINVKAYKRLWQPLSFALVVIALSYGILLSNICIHKGRGLQCVVTQPNINPYTEKFYGCESYIQADEQLRLAIEPAKQLIDSNTAIVLLPETALVGVNEESQLQYNAYLATLRPLAMQYNTTVIVGAETYKSYKSTTAPTKTARPDGPGYWYDSYNTAMALTEDTGIELYHKSKLVVGVETMPFDFLNQLSLDLGGMTGSLGISDQAYNLHTANKLPVATLVCYESIYGDYCNDFINKGAQLIAVITNDAWWGNTPGYQQHLLYAKIRSIETRKPLIRSANTGISAVIDKNGNIQQRTQFNERTAFKCTVWPNNTITFYTRYGNLLGLISVAISIALFVGLLIKRKSSEL
jgi:apolipoprotein N-acyltransferase